MLMRKLWITALLLGGWITCRAQYPGYAPVTDITKFKNQLSAASQKMSSLKSDFVQEKNLSMLSEKIVSKGIFWFKKENLVRMEYKQPFQYLMIINKNNVYIKDGQKENKISAASTKIFRQINRLMVDCVQGTVMNNPDFGVKAFEGNSGFLVELTPVSKGLKDYFKTIQVVIDKKDYSVMKIEMIELSGDYTIMNFVNKELNVNIPDALFAIN
jgi:outer membrane lipoprotein-sorting protein